MPICVLIGTLSILIPTNAYSDYSYRMIPTTDSNYEIFMQYQIRDQSQNLVCVVQSSVTSFFDSPLTSEYLKSYSSYKTIEKDNETTSRTIIE